MRPWLAALALVLAVLVCGCGGEKGGKDRDENLDLKDMTAHLRELKIQAPESQAKQRLAQHRGVMEACLETMGPGAHPDGQGGCVCGPNHVQNATVCVPVPEGKRPLFSAPKFVRNMFRGAPPVENSLEGAARLGRDDEGAYLGVRGLPACHTRESCLHAGLALGNRVPSDMANCLALEHLLEETVAGVNASHHADQAKAVASAKEVKEWIQTMRAQNNRMVQELGRYAAQSAENKRILAEMSRMEKEEKLLEAEIKALSSKVLEAQRDATAAEDKTRSVFGAQASKCNDRVNTLKDGLTSRAIPLPKLD